jgi:hypothetical protein
VTIENRSGVEWGSNACGFYFLDGGDVVIQNIQMRAVSFFDHRIEVGRSGSIRVRQTD